MFFKPVEIDKNAIKEFAENNKDNTELNFCLSEVDEIINYQSQVRLVLEFQEKYKLTNVKKVLDKMQHNALGFIKPKEVTNVVKVSRFSPTNSLQQNESNKKYSKILTYHSALKGDSSTTQSEIYNSKNPQKLKSRHQPQKIVSSPKKITGQPQKIVFFPKKIVGGASKLNHKECSL